MTAIQDHPRRQHLRLAAALLATFATTAAAQANDLTVTGWGGAGQEAQDEVYFKPFTAETKIALQQDTWGGGYGILKAKVDSGNINWDVVQAEADEMELGCADGILLPLDWDKIGTRDQFLPGTATDCGAGVITWSFALAWDGAVQKAAPTSWADMWDLEKFPGKRGLRKSAKGSLEIALMADGVPPAEVYDVLATPEGVDRAFAELDKIKPQIVWWESGAQVLQLLASGEIGLTSAYDGSLHKYAASEKRDFELTYNQALYASDYWVILKGTQHEAEAQQLVAYLSQPDHMAKLPEKLPYGVPNAEAMAKVPEALAATLLTSKANVEKAVPIDTAFWLDNGEELNKRFAAWLAQ